MLTWKRNAQINCIFSGITGFGSRRTRLGESCPIKSVERKRPTKKADKEIDELLSEFESNFHA